MTTRLVQPSLLRDRTALEDAKHREDLLRPYLPTLDDDDDDLKAHNRYQRRHPIRNFLVTRFYRLILWFLHLFAGVYFRIRYTYHFLINRSFAILYYHHKTPELIQKDVKQLDRLPQHVSVILELDKEGGVETLIDHVAEISCWCACAGIPMLSVYEQTGALKKYLATSHRVTAQRLQSYFGRQRPKLKLFAPHSPSFANGDVTASDEDEQADLEVTFISEEDGRESLVDLTKTLCEMTQRGKMNQEDISMELIDAELESLTIPEPDLLILFSPSVKLHGYPPWQIRLTEIFHVPDNDSVSYQVFLRALYRYAKTEMRFGR